MTTSSEAFNDTMGRFKTVWDTVVPALAVKYPNVATDALTQACIDTGTTAWARIMYRVSDRDQTSIAGPTKAKYTAEGIVMISIYTPTGDGGVLSRTLTALVETAYEGIATLNGVWYRNVRTETYGNDGIWWREDVIAEWSYDEVR